MKPRVIIGVVFIIGFTSLLMVNLSGSISSYVDFEEAERTGQRAYVVGQWMPDLPHGFDEQRMMFRFHMKDESGNVRQVNFNRSKPNNFEDAESLVVIGTAHDGVFHSDDMLVKCPSKYNDASNLEMTSM